MITLRAHGTWLHGDPRGSVDRFHNQYGTPRLAPNPSRRRFERSLMKIPPVKLTIKRREAIYRGIRETCKIRSWALYALNVRSNHLHSVLTANCSSKKVRAALKANATRTMRESGCWESEKKSVEWRRKQKIHLDPRAANRSDRLCTLWSGNAAPELID